MLYAEEVESLGVGRAAAMHAVCRGGRVTRSGQSSNACCVQMKGEAKVSTWGVAWELTGREAQHAAGIRVLGTEREQLVPRHRDCRNISTNRNKGNEAVL